MIEIPEVHGLVNLGGIESPGLTSAPAIAQRVVDLLHDAGEKLTHKTRLESHPPARPHFRRLPREEQIKLIRTDPRYARIICRCEMVTEGEIFAEITHLSLLSPMTPSNAAPGWAPGVVWVHLTCRG